MQAITVFGDHTFGTKAELKEREYSICRNSYNFAKQEWKKNSPVTKKTAGN